MPGAPRAPDDKKKEAEKLFGRGMKLTDIARKLDVPGGTVRSWKNRGKWGGKPPSENQRSVADDDAGGSAALQKRKRGGQPGNRNSVGHAASVPRRNKNAEKHGAFSKVYLDALDDEELDLIDNMDDAEEQHLIMQLQVFSVRERRFMKSIRKYQDMEMENHGLAVEGVAKTKKVEDLTDIDGESIEPGKYRKVTETTVTHTKAVMGSIVTLETELTKIQKAKTRAIEALAQLRTERQKLESESGGNDTVDDWVSAVVGEEVGIHE